MRKCKCCKTPFTPARPMQSWCGLECAVTLGQRAVAKKKAKDQAADRKATRARLDAMRTKPQLIKLAQQAFNGFIRARDAAKPCISCSRPLSGLQVGGAFDCGHYRSVGSAPHLRFVEDNAHGQCKHCNSHLAGNHVSYRQGLIARIGLQAVESIESDQTVRKYAREGLIEIARHYRAEARKLQKAKEAAL
jgi:hypothetical protein